MCVRVCVCFLFFFHSLFVTHRSTIIRPEPRVLQAHPIHIRCQPTKRHREGGMERERERENTSAPAREEKKKKEKA